MGILSSIGRRSKQLDADATIGGGAMLRPGTKESSDGSYTALLLR